MLRHEGPAGAGVRRAKVLQGIFMQAMLAVVILFFAYLSRDEPRTLYLTLWTLLIPAGFVYAYHTAFKRGEVARAGGTWTPDFERAEAKRMTMILGGTLMVWIAGAAAIYLLA